MNENPAFGFMNPLTAPAPRIPISLCLDCSGSMEGEPIEALNACVELFYQAALADESIREAVELSLVTFGPAQQEMDFTPLTKTPMPPHLSAFGPSPLGEALKIAMDTLDNRKVIYKNAGVGSYQSWLVLMSDGRSYGEDPQILDAEIQRIASAVYESKLAVYAIGLGPAPDLQTLNKLSPLHTPATLETVDFQTIFA